MRKDARIKNPIIRVALFVFALIVSSFVFAVLAALVLYLIFDDQFQKIMEQVDSLPYLLPLYLFQFSIYIALIVFFCRVIDRRPLQELELFQADGTGMFMKGSLVALVLLLLAFAVIYILEGVEIVAVAFPAFSLLLYSLLFFLVAVGEEWIFRGYMFTNLRESLSDQRVLMLTSLLFTLVHMGNQHIASLAVLNIFLAGMLLGTLRLYRGGLWLAIGLHFGWNFIQGPILGFAVSGIQVNGALQIQPRGAVWLSGGAFGLEGSVVATVLMIGALYLLYPWKLQKQGEQDDGMGTA